LFRRDLICNMLAHSLTDFVGFMLARLRVHSGKLDDLALRRARLGE